MLAQRLVNRIRLLPLLMVVAGIALSFRFGVLIEEVSDLFPAARAQTEEAASQDDQSTSGGGSAQQGGETADITGTDGQGQSAPSGDALDSVPEDDAVLVTDPSLMSRSEIELLQDLAKRRAELDSREEEIEIREQLLASTEQRIDKRIAELEALQGKIESLIVQHEEQEDEQLRSIVRVYESMKAKDSARIFERLDLPIQVAVATRMKENKVAEMLAEMNADAAKILTTKLAERAQLPSMEGLEEAKAALP